MKIRLILIIIIVLLLSSCNSDNILLNYQEEKVGVLVTSKDSVEENSSISDDVKNNIVEDSNIGLTTSTEITEKENFSEVRYRIIADTLNVRSTWNIDSEIISQLYENDEVNIIDMDYDDENQKWLKVELDKDTCGWVASWFARPIYDDESLGKYILINEDEKENILLTEIMLEELKFSDQKSIDINALSVQEQSRKISEEIKLTESKQLKYVYFDDININKNNEIYMPAVIDNSKILFWIIKDDETLLYLCRKDIYTEQVDIVYTLSSTKEIYSYDRFNVMSISDKVVIFSIDQDLVIYDIYLNEVVSHKRFLDSSNYDVRSTMSVSSDGKKQVYEYGDTIALSDIDFMDNVILAHGKDYWSSETDGSIPRYPRFSNNNPDKVRIIKMGWEWINGWIWYDSITGNFEEVNAGRYASMSSKWLSGGSFISIGYDADNPENGSLDGVTDDNNHYREFTDDYFDVSQVYCFAPNSMIALNQNLELIKININSNQFTKLIGFDENDKVITMDSDSEIIITKDKVYKIYKRVN
ncbi:MAG: SH3 domain-containing protein [Clostridiales bacterium]|nr:SH3 domain-containing protein [Clostridiales bacterium]